jgi:hypothetical protein
MVNDNWLWRRPIWREKAPEPIVGEPAELPASLEPVRPSFRRQWFDDECETMRLEIENKLMDAGLIPDSGTGYDPRLSVVMGYFYKYAEGLADADTVLGWVGDELDNIRDDPSVQLLGCEYAKIGFLAMGMPELASPFGRRAAGMLQRFRQLAAGNRPALEGPGDDTAAESV